MCGNTLDFCKNAHGKIAVVCLLTCLYPPMSTAEYVLHLEKRDVGLLQYDGAAGDDKYREI